MPPYVPCPSDATAAGALNGRHPTVCRIRSRAFSAPQRFTPPRGFTALSHAAYAHGIAPASEDVSPPNARRLSTNTSHPRTHHAQNRFDPEELREPFRLSPHALRRACPTVLARVACLVPTPIPKDKPPFNRRPRQTLRNLLVFGRSRIRLPVARSTKPSSKPVTSKSHPKARHPPASRRAVPPPTFTPSLKRSPTGLERSCTKRPSRTHESADRNHRTRVDRSRKIRNRHSPPPRPQAATTRARPTTNRPKSSRRGSRSASSKSPHFRARSNCGPVCLAAALSSHVP